MNRFLLCYVITCCCATASYSFTVFQNHSPENLIDKFWSKLRPLEIELWRIVKDYNGKNADLSNSVYKIVKKILTFTTNIKKTWPHNLNEDLKIFKNLLNNFNIYNNLTTVSFYFENLHNTANHFQNTKMDSKFLHQLVKYPLIQIEEELKNIQKNVDKNIYNTIKMDLTNRKYYSMYTINQIVHFFYIIINLVDLQGYFLIQLANLLKNFDKNNPKVKWQHINEVRQNYYSRSKHNANLIRTISTNQSALLWNCDPILKDSPNIIGDICHQYILTDKYLNIKCFKNTPFNSPNSKFSMNNENLYQVLIKWSLNRCSYCSCFGDKDVSIEDYLMNSKNVFDQIQEDNSYGEDVEVINGNRFEYLKELDNSNLQSMNNRIPFDVQDGKISYIQKNHMIPRDPINTRKTRAVKRKYQEFAFGSSEEEFPREIPKKVRQLRRPINCKPPCRRPLPKRRLQRPFRLKRPYRVRYRNSDELENESSANQDSSSEEKKRKWKQGGWRNQVRLAVSESNSNSESEDESEDLQRPGYNYRNNMLVRKIPYYQNRNNRRQQNDYDN